MSARFKKSRLIDQRAFAHRTRFLGLRAFRAYYDLTEYYWEFGRLFSEDSDLADVCGLHVQAFRRIKEQLSRLFEVDEVGLWRDPELEAERARAVRTSEAARANGRKGAQARWPAEDPEGMGWASEGAAEVPEDMANGMANPMPFAMVSATADGPEIDGSGMADAMASATPHATPRGSIDRSSIEDTESIDRSDPRAGAGEAMANGMASAIDPAMPAATDAATPIDPAPAPADVEPAASELHARVVVACGDNIAPELRRSQDVEPIRALMRDGFDLDREILPFLRDRVKALGTPLRTLRAKWIRTELEKARTALPVPRPGAPANIAPPLVFIAAGTPDWERWQAYGKASGKQPQGYPASQEQGGQRGWRFPSALPPALERPAVAAE